MSLDFAAMTQATIDQWFQNAFQLHQAGRLAEAEKIYREILAKRPDHAEALHLLGVVAMQMGRFEAAAESIRRAIRVMPGSAEAYYNLGLALTSAGKFEEAIAACRESIRLKPDLANGRYGLGNALRSVGRLDEAIASYRQAIRIKGDYAEVHSNLGNALRDKGQLDEAIACYRQAVRLNPGLAEAQSNLIYTLHFHPGYDGGMIREELRRWNQQRAAPLKARIRPHGNNRDPMRRLRIGYVSADFHTHASAFFLLPVFRNHDREQFEVFCYAQGAHGDEVNAQMKAQVQHWRQIEGVSDAEAAEIVRRDGIDILVDLKLHTAGNRLLIFAPKPAPVQVTWLGYPGSTGLDTMDYRLTDPQLDPAGLDDGCYSERSVHLPETFWCYDPLTSEPVVSSLPAQDHGFVTFGCLNNFCKVNEQALQLWARVMKSADRSRLILLCPEGSHREELLNLMQREGIDGDRIEMIGRIQRTAYLELYRRIDVGLDTFPCNGHTTSLDSFWMGVPVITLAGRTVFGRAGVSQLTNLGLAELIARTPEQFVEIATGLGNDLPRLAELRRTLRARMEASPLMDAPRFARNIEAAYREMWRKWCSNSGLEGAVT